MRTILIKKESIMQRFSKNRQAIMDCLSKTDTHPTAEWIFEQLKPSFPNLSLGTVYRNLTQLEENGEIRSMGNVNGMEHFDGNAAPHPHAVCSVCGAITDLPEQQNMERMLHELSGITDYRISELQLTGICPDCLVKMEAQKGS